MDPIKHAACQAYQYKSMQRMTACFARAQCRRSSEDSDDALAVGPEALRCTSDRLGKGMWEA